MTANKDYEVRLKSRKCSIIEGLLSQVEGGDCQPSQEIIERLNGLHQEICISVKFSVFSMLQYHRQCLQFHELTNCEFRTRIPDFFEDDYLESRFLSNPSDYGIVLALAIKSLEKGEPIRARQLFRRVASSRYREHELAVFYLTKYFSFPHDPRAGSREISRGMDVAIIESGSV